MTLIESIKNALDHWITVVTAVLGVLSFVWDPAGALAGVVWSNLGTIFPAVSIAAADLAPRVDWLTQDALDSAVLVIGALYVAKLADKTIDNAQDKL